MEEMQNDTIFYEARCLGIYETSQKLNEAREKIANEKNAEESAYAYKNDIIPLMNKLRELVDAAEVIMPKSLWPMPSYAELTYWY